MDTPLARESYTAEEGGILNGAAFPDAPPRRWHEAAFENRLKHFQQAMRPAPRPAARPSSARHAWR